MCLYGDGNNPVERGIPMAELSYAFGSSKPAVGALPMEDSLWSQLKSNWSGANYINRFRDIRTDTSDLVQPSAKTWSVNSCIPYETCPITSCLTKTSYCWTIYLFLVWWIKLHLISNGLPLLGTPNNLYAYELGIRGGAYKWRWWPYYKRLIIQSFNTFFSFLVSFLLHKLSDFFNQELQCEKHKY